MIPSSPAVCVVTGSRAEYGLLRPVLQALAASSRLRMQLVVTGMHLCTRFGDTWREIEADGWTIDRSVPMLDQDDDSAVGITRSVARGVEGMGAALADLRPDLLLILGDRFEILCAAQAALFARIPVAHLCGGDVTAGAWDDAIRHSISKMAHLHFVTHESSARRLRQLGEPSDRVHCVGSPAIDSLRCLKLSGPKQLSETLSFALRKQNFLITYHPETLDRQNPMDRLRALLGALEEFCPDTGLLFTMPNADAGGRALFSMIEEFVERHSNARAWPSLGQFRYLSAMAAVQVVVGNSSSGITEAPFLKVATVNIGARQEGRPKATSVIDSGPSREQIVEALTAALSLDCSETESLYGDGRCAQRILSILEAQHDFAALLDKRFVDLAEVLS